AGESHAATGTYAMAIDAPAATLHLTMNGQDHVAFHGFDGPMPIHYGFDLVSTPGLPCAAR
ncbi:MAG: hypothetical protein JSR54_08700, partial [Proteobacteria bacterium]|nr:hypothetical protein [Pseudomonadota bacterium]